jgi:2-polyprenyl-3-methyl-5-hydroxy-6-metoxy-1,4-benzoquinol methylase
MYYHLIKSLYRIKNLRKGVTTVTTLQAVEELLKKTEELNEKSSQKALEFARSWFYLPSINTHIDPVSEEYFSIQKKHYETFSGKSWGTFDIVAQDERIKFNNLADLYPYALKDHQLVGSHLQKIGYWISRMSLKPTDKIIEFGAGSAELAIYLAQTGFNVTPTDISQTYVDVIQQKAGFLRLPMNALRVDMATFNSNEKFDVVIFCEAFHHASNFLGLLENLKKILNPGGRVYLCGEPVTYYPYPWGVRTDGESIWMARNLGWLELGFDRHYFKNLVQSMGFDFSMSANKSIDHAASVICLTRRDY